MSVFQSLSVIALREVVGGICNAAGIGSAGEAVVGMLTKHFTDPSQKLTSALRTANDRAWKSMEIALAGDSLLDRCKNAGAAAEDKAFAEQIRVFLDLSPLKKVKLEQRPILEKALQELRSARSKGILAGGSPDPAILANEALAFARYSDPQALIAAEQKLLTRVADAMRGSCPNLYRIRSPPR